MKVKIKANPANPKKGLITLKEADLDVIAYVVGFLDGARACGLTGFKSNDFSAEVKHGYPGYIRNVFYHNGHNAGIASGK